jgi:hypothetical protein
MEVNHTQAMTSAGIAAPASALILMIVVGINCMDAPFITQNTAIAAVGNPPESLPIRFMAAKPAGVAALPIPTIFDTIFVVM